MSQIDDLIEIALQIFFGFIGVVLAVAAIHYRDSLCSVILRRYREPPTQCRNFHVRQDEVHALKQILDYELEAGSIEVEMHRRTSSNTLFCPPVSLSPSCGEVNVINQEKTCGTTHEY
jgi:hypothetical protein